MPERLPDSDDGLSEADTSDDDDHEREDELPELVLVSLSDSWPQ
jgi:hypothetical protein